MARPRTSQFWIKKISAQVQNHPALKASALNRLFKAEIAQGKIQPPIDAEKVPDERTIRRIIQQFRKQPELERKSHSWFQWPGSMDAGDLPWEASRACLDLLQWHTEQGLEPPLVRDAKWYWRITQAIPDASVQMRSSIAYYIGIISELATERPAKRLHIERQFVPFQWLLAYEPWKKEQLHPYNIAMDRLSKDQDGRSLFAPIKFEQMKSTMQHCDPTLDPFSFLETPGLERSERLLKSTKTKKGFPQHGRQRSRKTKE